MFTEQMNHIARGLASQLEIEFAKVMTDYAIAPTDVARRCCLTRVIGDTVEVLQVDGKAVMEIHDVETATERKDDRYVIIATRKFRRLDRAAE